MIYVKSRSEPIIYAKIFNKDGTVNTTEWDVSHNWNYTTDNGNIV